MSAVMKDNSEYTATDIQLMRVALELAERGRFTTMPNPRVGCVIACGDEIVGSGWHQKAGEAHAEILALQEAGSRAKGATVYLTLEPCNHQGRTGPCAEALIQAGIKRVVIAANDPNPLVDGGGQLALIDADIQVSSGLLVDEANELNRGFNKRMSSGMPFVSIKVATSLDGRTAMASGESQWITGPAARQRVQILRASSCAMITGIGTVLQDDPALTVRESDLGQPVERQPALVVVDSSLRLPLDSKVITESSDKGRRLIVACLDTAANERKRALEAEGVEILSLKCKGDAKICLHDVLKILTDQQFNEVLVEAGATLMGGFMQQRLVDELLLFQAPKLLGSSGKPLVDLPIEVMADAIELSIQNVERVADDWLFQCKPKFGVQ